MIANDGTVMYDTRVDASFMENHSDREEFKEASKLGKGKGSRFSKTLTEETVYFARALSDDRVLRIAGSHRSIFSLILLMWRSIVIFVIVTFVASYFAAQKISAFVVRPLNEIDLDNPLENDTYDEISPLLNKIARQQGELEKKENEILEKKKEFDAVIKNMNEGLVLMSPSEEILSINSAAKLFFGSKSECAGDKFINIERSPQVNELLARARKDGKASLMLERGGRRYQLNATLIEANEDMYGMALLIFDETEKVDAEQNRREFTANVVHELKSPIHTIMGNSELILSGLATEQKVPECANAIYNEAHRLLRLIDDIIRLSKLDEKVELVFERASLAKLMEEEVSRREGFAKENGITIEVSGEDVEFDTAVQLIHEISYNLLDNSIKYNKENGKVFVNYGSTDKEIFFSVSDTGIGIPAGHTARIFERFYRVDKSHSRASGGTGLGLSIVKHAVAYLGGNVELESEEGVGTKISVYLPKKIKT